MAEIVSSYISSSPALCVNSQTQTRRLHSGRCLLDYEVQFHWLNIVGFSWEPERHFEMICCDLYTTHLQNHNYTLFKKILKINTGIASDCLSSSFLCINIKNGQELRVLIIDWFNFMNRGKTLNSRLSYQV